MEQLSRLMPYECERCGSHHITSERLDGYDWDECQDCGYTFDGESNDEEYERRGWGG